MILFTIILLAIMEISLSFDNAVINASILQSMEPKWQKRFITWGMPIAVFGMRLIFPILIVSMASGLSPHAVEIMALNAPQDYANYLSAAHVKISAFGGIFLLMVFLAFHCDDEKELHWLPWIEKPLLFFSNRSVRAILVGIAIGFLASNGSTIDMDVFYGGFAAIILFSLLDLFSMTATPIRTGLASLLYLEILDASCSFDGVIGAFVLTNNIVLIMIGLGIGAFAIRSLTLYLVRGGALKEFIYLEHGAHYGIGALAAIMLTDIFYPVPEPVTGMMGMSFIGLSLISSVRHRRTTKE